LDIILFSNNYDDLIIEQSNNILNKETIAKFKKVLIRLIISDSYLFLYDDKPVEVTPIIHVNSNYDEDDYEENNEIKEILNTSPESLFANMCLNLLEHIKTCVINNKIILPEDDELRINLYSLFL